MKSHLPKLFSILTLLVFVACSKEEEKPPVLCNVPAVDRALSYAPASQMRLYNVTNHSCRYLYTDSYPSTTQCGASAQMIEPQIETAIYNSAVEFDISYLNADFQNEICERGLYSVVLEDKNSGQNDSYRNILSKVTLKADGKMFLKSTGGKSIQASRCFESSITASDAFALVVHLNQAPANNSHSDVSHISPAIFKQNLSLINVEGNLVRELSLPNNREQVTQLKLYIQNAIWTSIDSADIPECQ